jgi:hypothetical protein
MHRIVAFTALLLGVAFWGLGRPAIAGDYYSSDEGYDGGGYQRSSYYDEGYRQPTGYDRGYRHRYPSGIYSSCCYRKITKYVRVGDGNSGGYQSSNDGDSYYSNRPYRSSSYDRGYSYRPRYYHNGYDRLRSYSYQSSYDRPRYYGRGYSSHIYRGGGYSERPRYYDVSYSYSARAYDSGYGSTSYGSGPRLYSGYYNGYANVATDCYSRKVRIDDGHGGWVWGKRRSCD